MGFYILYIFQLPVTEYDLQNKVCYSLLVPSIHAEMTLKIFYIDHRVD